MLSYIIKAFQVFLVLPFAMSLMLLGCTKDDIGDTREEVPQQTRLVNEFVISYHKFYYLWTEKVNYTGKDPRYIEDPFALFEGFTYSELDKWSYLTDDAQAMFNSYEGVQTSYGYSLVLGQFSNTGTYFAVVQFVYPNSQAHKAGIKRGDIILAIDGQDITEENYLNLYYSSRIKLQFGIYDPQLKAVIPDGRDEVSVSASVLSIDPVNASTIIEEEGHKVGYICYTDFVESSHSKLAKICSEFKSAGVTDVVLDLRYNPGGASISSTFLSSLFVPAEHISKKSVFLYEVWNSNLASYMQSSGYRSYASYFTLDALPYNLDLDRIFILTTHETASASESAIVGLAPYMDVVTIGTTTHGKYCSSLLLQPVDRNNNVIKEIENWAMSLVAFKFANKDGFTDFTGGLDPDYIVQDDLISAVYPFGDKNDPHLAKALELITGKSQENTVKSKVAPVPGSSMSGSSEPGYTLLKKQTRQLKGHRGGFNKIHNPVL